MFKHYKIYITTILLVIIIPTFNVNYVRAATVDDLRAYLGMTVEKRNTTMINVKNIDGEQSIIEAGTESKNRGALSLQRKIEDLKNLESRYKQAFTGGEPAIKLIAFIESIKDTKEKIAEQEKLNNLLSRVNIEGLIKSSITNKFETEQTEQFGNPRFSIGTIGDMAISPTSNLLSLVRPFGYRINSDGTREIKNNSISLEIPQGNNVQSQWNGLITHIDEDVMQNSMVITISHGGGLVTVYHHVVPSDIFIGQRVNQGDVIGVATDKNYIKYQIILDDRYINPILIFGNRSRKMFNDWNNRSLEVYTVAVGEEFYHTESMIKVNPNREIVGQNTIEGAAEVEGDYFRPNPGVVR